MLSKIFEAAKQSATRPKSAPSEEAHAAAVNELDNSRISLAKSISDAENTLASQEAELAALRDEYQSLKNYDPAIEHQKDLDGTAYASVRLWYQCCLTITHSLRLKIYRGMGFDIAFDDKKQVSNVIVRTLFPRDQALCTQQASLKTGSQTGDVHSVTLDKGQSRAEYTHQLWKLASSWLSSVLTVCLLYLHLGELNSRVGSVMWFICDSCLKASGDDYSGIP